MKKNLFLMAIAAIAMLATSCQKESGSDFSPIADTKLKVRIANVEGKSRAVGAPAAASQITLNDGIIFIIDAAGKVTYQESINTGDITSTGQELAKQVAKTDKVYIVGNLTTELTAELSAATGLTLAQINSKVLSITSEVGQDYTKVTLANANAEAAGITVTNTDNTATVKINIAPVYSRIELAKVEGEAGTNNSLTSFDVKAVYVTDYYLGYTLGGSFSGAMYEQRQSTNFTLVEATMKDEGTWSSADNSGKIEAVAGSGDSWVYNVPAGALPRLIVQLGAVTGTMNGNNIANTSPHFLTLTGYSKSTTPILEMERGKIYRIENLKFALDQMTDKPNEDQVTLTVTVAITDWVVEVVDGNL